MDLKRRCLADRRWGTRRDNAICGRVSKPLYWAHARTIHNIIITFYYNVSKTAMCWLWKHTPEPQCTSGGDIIIQVNWTLNFNINMTYHNVSIMFMEMRCIYTFYIYHRVLWTYKYILLLYVIRYMLVNLSYCTLFPMSINYILILSLS